ncbi:MAG: hypothetical protein ACLGIZ_11655 [Acidimicrobiia bacterium]
MAYAVATAAAAIVIILATAIISGADGDRSEVGEDSSWDIELRDVAGGAPSARSVPRMAPPTVSERQEEAESRAGEHSEQAAKQDRQNRAEARRRAQAAAAGHLEADTAASGGVSGPVMYWRRDDGWEYEESGIEGVLEHDDGCLYLRSSAEPTLRHQVLWQFGTRWLPDLGAVVLPDGTVVLVGDEISGGGGFRYPDRLEYFTTDAAVRAQVARCASFAEGEVGVLQGPAPSVTPQ